MFHAAHVTYSQSTSTSARILSREQLRVSAASVSITSQIPDKRDQMLFSATHAAYTSRLKKNKQITTYYVLLPLSLPLEKFLGSEAERLASFSYCKLNVTTPVQLYPQPSCRVVLNSDKRENIRSVVFAAARAPTSNEHFSAADSSPFPPSPSASAWTCFLLSCGPFVPAARILAFRNIFTLLRFVSSLARCSSSQRLKRLFRLVSPRVPLSGPWPIENRVNDFSASRCSDRSSEIISRRSRATFVESHSRILLFLLSFDFLQISLIVSQLT